MLSWLLLVSLFSPLVSPLVSPPPSPPDPWALFKYECPASAPPPPVISQPPNPPPPPRHTIGTPPRKYNYASPDCSARIHSSSPLTQHAPSLLHKSRDRYMLTPCRANEHWVVVELCDEIRIEAIEIAVWEFFSGVVRQVQVSVGDGDGDGGDRDGDGGGWKQVGSFIGKNIRGPQTFTLPQPTAFHRFIRLDFSSYYGSEYYCPVSSLKVYGMNQMEAFKWEQKQLNHNREKEMLHNREKEMLHQEEDVRRAKETQERDRKERERDERDKQQQREKELDELEKLLHEQAGRLVPSKLLTDSPFSTDPPPAPSTTFISKHGDDEKREDSSIPTNDSLAAATSSESSTTPSSPYTRAVPRSDSSESIYAFIIRRLDALEGNSSLVARYMEEQAKVMRSMLERVKIGWDEWKGEWEDEDRARWQQEVCLSSPSFSHFSS